MEKIGENTITAEAAESYENFTYDKTTPAIEFKKGGQQYNVTTGAAATGTYASHEAAWRAAIQYSVNSGKRVKFTLSENWVASGSVAVPSGSTTVNVPVFGTVNSVGFTDEGGLNIPVGAKVLLDLNGKTLDRNLYKPKTNGCATAFDLPLENAEDPIALQRGCVIYLAGSTAAANNVQGKRPELEVMDRASASKGIDVTPDGVFIKGTKIAPGMIRGGAIANVGDNFIGGGIYASASELVISSGAIAYNRTVSRGGGISASWNCNLYIKGGAIAYNCGASMGGGVYITQSSIKDLSGGIIAYNHSRSMAGGIYLAFQANSVLNLDIARNADGTPVNKSDTGIVIANNKADSVGGGIYVRESDLLRLGLCKVTGNVSPEGGGIAFEKGAQTPEVRYNPYILGNSDLKRVASNMYFIDSTQKVKVTGALTKNAKPQIGVFMGTLGDFTSDFVKYHSGEMASDYFMSDNPNYTVNMEKNKEGSLILLNSYQAKWNSAVNSSLRNSGAEVLFEMNLPTTLTNWTATNGSFGTGIGFEEGGALLVPEGANVKINLKKYAIDRGLKAATEHGYVIKVLGTLTITGESTINDSNGTITGGMITGGFNSSDEGCGIIVHEGGTLNLNSGAVYNNIAASVVNEGGGVQAWGANAKFNMTGGFISKNSTVGNTGSGVDGAGLNLNEGAIATMSGGEISWNSSTQCNSSHGGGVAVGISSVFNMSGGAIKNNTTTACGGGVFMEGTMTMTGGSIINNRSAVGNRGSGGGVFATRAVATAFNISGAPTISHNVGGSSGASYDLEFEKKGTMNLSITGALTGGKIGLTQTDRTAYTTGLKTNGGIKDVTAARNIFFSNDPSYVINTNSNGEIIFGQQTSYADMWKSAIDLSKSTNGTSVKFTLSLNKNWEATNGSFGTTANYYENGALLVPSGANIVIDLNGYKIDRKLTAATANGYVLAVRGTATIEDSTKTTVSAEGALVPANGKQGGAITGGFNNTASVPGGVLVAGTLNLKSGCIYGNKSSAIANRGGVGVYVAGSATLNMTGGYISKNVTVGTSGGDGLDGGGVDLQGKMNMSGGEISWNETTMNSTSSGAGICVCDTLNYSGGVIKNNKATGVGGGVLALGSVKFSGKLNINGNTSKLNDDIVIYSGAIIEITGKVTADTAAQVAFNINVGPCGTITSGAGKYGMTVTDIRNAFTAADSTYMIGGKGSGDKLEGYLGKPVTALDVIKDVVYNGKDQTLIDNFNKDKVTATCAFGTGTAATVTAVTGKAAGSYKFVFTLKDGYVWDDSALDYSADSTVTKTLTATIAQKELTDASKDYSEAFDGKAHGITVSASGFVTGETLANTGTIKYGVKSGTYDKTANPTYTDVTTVTVYYQITFANYKTITGSKTVKITAKDITGATVTLADQDLTYNNKSQAKEPSVSIKLGSDTTATSLKNNTDFTLSYSNTNGGADNTTNAGTITVTVKGKGNYTGTASTAPKYEIKKKTLTAASSCSGKDYDGGTDAAISTITVGAITGYADGDGASDVTVAIASGTYDDKNVGAAHKVTVTYKLSGTKAGNYTIADKEISGVAISPIAITGITGVSFNGKTYDGTTATTLNGKNASATFAGMVSGDSLEIKSATAINFDTKDKGTGKTVTATGITLGGTDAGNYTIAAGVTATGTADIAALDISTGTTITVSGSYTYNASAIEPTTFTAENSSLKTTDKSLASGTDFTVSYSDNTDAGTATITLTGTGNFTGSASQSFTIAKAQISAVTWDENTYTYDGTAKQPKIKTVTTTATAGLPANVADMFNYSGAETDQGDNYTATAVLKDEYAKNYEITSATDKKTVTQAFKITLAALATATVTAYAATYDGKKHRILTAFNATTVGTADNNIKWYYSTTNLAATDAGWTQFADLSDLPEVTNVSESATYYFKVTADNHEAKLLNAEVKIEAKSLGTGTTDVVAGITADDIPAYTYDGTAKEPTPVISDANAVITANDYSFTYNNNIAAGTKTAVLIITGQGNYTGSYQILYTIDQKEISDASVTIAGIVDKIFNNGEQKLSPTVTDTAVSGGAALVENNDFTVAYEASDGNPATDFTNVGAITVVITGKGNYKGEKKVTYDITEKDISPAGVANVATIANQTFTGSDIKPEPDVKVTFDSEVTLTKGTDFDYSYADNRDAGTATVTITAKGNYSGSVSVTFTIDPKEITSISGITADNKVYDGTTTFENAVQTNGDGATAAEIHFDSAVIAGNEDGADLVVKTATGVFDDKNTGKRTVTVTVTALDGAKAGNYTLPSGGVQVTISDVEIIAREIVIEWGSLEHVYDGKSYVPAATVKNKVEGDTVELVTGLDGADSAVMPGNYAVKVTNVINNDAGNYALPSTITTAYKITTENTSAEIKNDSLTQVYDGTVKLPVMQKLDDETGEWSTLEDDGVNYTVTYTAQNGGSLTEVEGKNLPVNAGTYKVTIKLSPNYTWSDLKGGDTRDFTLTVTPATVTGVTLADATETYTGAEFSLAVDWSGAQLNGNALGKQPDGVTVAYFYDGASATGVAGAGSHTVTAKFTVNGNYNAIADLTRTLTIEKAEISLDGVSFDDGTAAFDGSAHTLAVSGSLDAKLKAVYTYEKDGASFGSDGVTAVGVYNVTVTFAFVNAADADNYKIVKGGAEVTSLTATLEITKQAAVVSGIVFEDATVTYDGNVHKLQVSGTAEGIKSVTYEYKRGANVIGADGVKDAGVYTVTATFVTDGNYAPVDPITKTLTIEKAPLTVTADDKVITYGDDPASAAFTATFAGLASGDGEASLGTPVIKVNSAIYAIFGDAGSYADAIEVSGLSGAATANYEITYVAGALTVNKRVIQVVWYNDEGMTAQDLSYTYAAGTVHTPYANVINAVNGDTVTVTVAGGKTDAGVDYVAEATAVSNANYVLPVSGLKTTFSIIPQPKTGVIIWSQDALYYDGTEQKPKAYFYESENAYAPTELSVTVNAKSINAGSYTATVSIGGNYTLTGETVKNFTIEKRDVYIRVGDMTAKYSDSIDVSGADWAYEDGSLQFVAGETYTLTFTCPNITGIGKYPISGKFTSANSANYNVHFAGGFIGGEEDGKCGTLTVTEGVYDMSGVSFTGTEVTYDGLAHGIGVSGLPAGVTASFDYAIDGWSYGADGVKNAGVYTVTVSFAGDANYAKIANKTATLTVRKAGLTVKANDHRIVYGDMPANGGAAYSIDGIETSGELSGTLVIAVSYEQYGDAGKYKIVPSGLTSDNYEISYVQGTLTVAPREISVKWYADSTASSTDLNYDYDGAEHLPFAVATGTLRGDTVTFTVSGAKTEAGTNYTAEITAVSNANYTVKKGEESVTFSIITKMCILWDNSLLVYNGQEQAPEAYYFDDNGDKHSLTVTVSGEHKNAGVEYTATVTGVPAGVTGSTDYKYTISAKKLTVEVGSGSLVYGKVNEGLSALLAQLKNGLTGADGFEAADGVPVTLACGIDNSSAVGVYAITATCTNANYEVIFVNGNIEITKAAVDTTGIVFNDLEKNYDGLVHTLTASNLPAGITGVTYSYEKDGVEVSANGVADAGEYTVKAKFTVDGNYNEITQEFTAKLTIKQSDLSGKVTFTGATVTYDGETHYIFVTGAADGILGVTYDYAMGGNGGLDGAKQAGTYTVTAKFTVGENYKPLSDLTATLTVEKANLTVTAKDGNVVYGETPAAGGYGYTVSGLAAGDNADGVLGALTYSFETVTGVGEYDITVSGTAETNNYRVTYAAGVLTVKPYTLTNADIKWFDAKGGNALGADGKFVYTYAAGQLRLPYAETATLVNGETVTLTVTGGKTATGYGYVAEITSLSGEKAANYVLPAEGLKVTFDILPEPVTGKIIWDYEPLYYDGQKQAPKAYYFTEEGGTRYPLTVTVEGEAINVGTYTATASVDGLEVTLMGETSIKFSIVARPVFVVIGDAEIKYGASASSDMISWSYADGSLRFISDDNPQINFLFGTVEGVGKYPVSAQFICDDVNNYKVTFSGSWVSADADNGKFGTLTVVKASYDMSGVAFAGTEITYDGKPHALTVNGLPAGVTAICEYVADGFGYGADGVKDAGVYTVTVKFTGDANYEAIPNATATLTVKKASLTVKANDVAAVYGDAPKDAGVTYTGFVNGDTESTAGVISGTVKFTHAYATGGNAGTYAITPSGLTARNYDIIYKAGSLEVAPRAITVVWYDDETASTQNFVYTYDGTTEFLPYAVAQGLVNGDTVTLTVEGAQRYAGMGYTARVTGVSNANYTLPADGSAECAFSVMAKTYGIVWDNSPLYYNGEIQKPKAYYFDGDGVRHELEVTVTKESKNVGEYIARAEAKADDPNKDLISGDTTHGFTINALKVSVIINSLADVTFGGTVAILNTGWTYAEGSAHFAAADGNPVTLSSGATADGAGAGKYVITGVCGNSNYEVTFTDGYVTIVKAQPDMSGADYGTLTVDYDGLVHTVTVSGLPAYVTAVCTYYKDGALIGTDGVREAGVYNVVISFTVSSDNHAPLENVEKTFTINKLAADISGLTFGDLMVVYDGTERTIRVSGSAAGLTGVTYTCYEEDGVTEVADGAVKAGVYKIKAEFSFDGNYDATAIGIKWATLTIEKAKLTVTAKDGNVVYGETPAAGGYGYTVSGLAYGDDEAAVIGAVIYSYGTISGAGEYAGAVIIAGNATSDNYDITYVNGKLTVTPREITATWQKSETDTSTDLVYEYVAGTNYVPYAVAGNTVNGDTLVLKVEVAQGKAGDDYTAQVVGIFLADGVTEATNYKLPAAGIKTAFSVKYTNPVQYEIIWNYGSVYYDGTAKKPAAKYHNGTDYVTIDPANITVYDTNGKEVSAIHAGSYVAKVTDTSVAFTNANVEFAFEVLARKVYLTVGDMTVAFGETPDMNSVGWTYAAESEENKFLSGDSFSVTFTCGTISGAGEYAISGAFGGNSDYEVTFTGGSWASAGANDGKCGTLTVVRAVYDMSKVAFAGTEAVYDGSAHTITVNGLPAGVTATVTYERGGVAYGGATGAGVYNVTIKFTGDNNHEAIPDSSATLTVKKAVLKVKANDSTVTYGEAPEANGVTYTGFVNGETENTAGVLGGTLAFEFGYSLGGNAGTYKVTPNGLTSDNYSVEYESGVLTVEKRTVTVTWFADERMNSQTLEYRADGTAHTPYAEAGNVVAGDRVTLTVTGAQTEAGVAYKAQITAVSNANYKLPETGTEVTFDILPEAYVVVWESTPFEFNGDVQAPKAYYFTANGERVELNVTVREGASVKAGTYHAEASLRSGNVTLEGETVREFTIEKRVISVIINDATSEYGQPATLNGWKYAEGSDKFVSGEPVYLSCAVTGTSPVGKYAITGICTDHDNYDVIFTDGVYTVEKAVIFAPVLADKVYNGETLTADVPAGRYVVVLNDGGVNAGVYRVVIQLNDYMNTRWSDTSLAAITLEFKITPTVNEWTTEFEVRGSVVAGSGNMYITRPEPKFGNADDVVIKYYKDSECTEEVTENFIRNDAPQGTYYAKVTLAGNGNYGELVSVYSFEVVGKLTVKLNWTNTDLVYNGEEQAPVAYIWLEGRRVTLAVSGAKKEAGTYEATTDKRAIDGTDLSGYEFDASGEATKISFTIKPRRITVLIEDDAESIYGSSAVDISKLNWTVTQGSVMANDDLGITFSCEATETALAAAGTYPITAACGNANYEVTFSGSWSGEDENKGKASTYTVRNAQIGVTKSSSAWFDEDGVIDRYQNFFVTLGERDEYGNYKYIQLKGNQTAVVSYSVNIDEYSSNIHDHMTVSQIMQMFAAGSQDKAPEIKQAGSWVVYYRIEAANHDAKYGIWKIQIESKDKYVTVKFLKPYVVTYGESVEGKNLLPELLNGGYIELGGAFKNTPEDYEQLKLLARAYAYEDVTDDDGLVDGGTSVSRYTIKLVFTDAALQNPMYANLEFKYATSNEMADTNLDKYEVVTRKITVEWGEKSFDYDGEEHIPEITLKGFVAVNGEGASVKLEGLKVGEAKRVELANGDVINVTVKLFSGVNAVDAGSFGIRVTIDDANYAVDAETEAATVTIVKPAEENRPEPAGLPVWAISLIAVGGAGLVTMAVVLIILKKKAGKAAASLNEDGFDDDVSGGFDDEE